MDDLVARLAKLDTCAASDALDRLGLRGATIGIRPVWHCPKIAGRAVTVKIKPAGLEKSKVHLGTPAIEAAQAGDVLVVDNGGAAHVPPGGGPLSPPSEIKRFCRVGFGRARPAGDERTGGGV